MICNRRQLVECLLHRDKQGRFVVYAPEWTGGFCAKNQNSSALLQ